MNNCNIIELKCYYLLLLIISVGKSAIIERNLTGNFRTQILPTIEDSYRKV
jgi:hypothetical protein